MGRGGAAHGRAAVQGGAGQDGTPTGRFAQETIDPPALQGIEDSCGFQGVSEGLTPYRLRGSGPFPFEPSCGVIRGERIDLRFRILQGLISFASSAVRTLPHGERFLSFKTGNSRPFSR